MVLDNRTLELQTILRVYLNEALLAVSDLEERRKAVVDAHAYYGPTSAISSQNLGKFYFMITQMMHRIDRLDRATQAYVHNLEGKAKATNAFTEEDLARHKALLGEHQDKVSKAKASLGARMGQIEGIVGKKSEKDLLTAIAAKYSDETNYALRLNKGLSLYADYIEKLETGLHIEPGFIHGDDDTPQRLSQVYLGLESQFEFEVEKPCPHCKENLTISALSPQLLCPLCGGQL